MCELCTQYKAKRLDAIVEDELHPEDGAPHRKVRKGHNRTKWCKGRVGISHVYELQALPNTFGTHWYYTMGEVCVHCNRYGWRDYGFFRSSERSRLVPVVCRICGYHNAKVPSRELKRMFVSGNHHVYTEEDYAIYYRPPTSCSRCRAGDPK